LSCALNWQPSLVYTLTVFMIQKVY
jgi:hypothetical protein